MCGAILFYLFMIQIIRWSPLCFGIQDWLKFPIPGRSGSSPKMSDAFLQLHLPWPPLHPEFNVKFNLPHLFEKQNL